MLDSTRGFFASIPDVIYDALSYAVPGGLFLLGIVGIFDNSWLDVQRVGVALTPLPWIFALLLVLVALAAVYLVGQLLVTGSYWTIYKLILRPAFGGDEPDHYKVYMDVRESHPILGPPRMKSYARMMSARSLAFGFLLLLALSGSRLLAHYPTATIWHVVAFAVLTAVEILDVASRFKLFNDMNLQLNSSDVEPYSALHKVIGALESLAKGVKADYEAMMHELPAPTDGATDPYATAKSKAEEALTLCRSARTQLKGGQSSAIASIVEALGAIKAARDNLDPPVA